MNTAAPRNAVLPDAKGDEMDDVKRLNQPTRFALRLGFVLALLVAVFIGDTVTDLEIAIGVFHIAVILIAMILLPKRSVVAIAAAAILLTVLSFFLTKGGSREAGLANTAISIAAIAITTYLALKLVAAEAAIHEARIRLTHMARLTSLGELTASIAHEVNQPLAAIVTSGNACLRWLDLAPPNLERARRSVERIVDDANRAGEVIQRVRGLAKGEPPQAERLELNQIVLDVLDLARGEINRRGISLRLNLADDLPAVFADRIQLQQVIGNLVLNAMEAMADGGERAMEIATFRDAARDVVFAIADSGGGLSPEASDHLFDAFWTTKKEGMGVGLTISRSIIEAHGGRIWALPRTGPGATFQFSLPID